MVDKTVKIVFALNFSRDKGVEIKEVLTFSPHYDKLNKMSLDSITSHLRSSWETICFRRSFRRYFRRRGCPLANDRGQAIIEYILLAVVAITIALALGKHFFTPLQKYGASVFSSTIACALEYGQLPAEITSEEGCDASLQAGGIGAGQGGSGRGSGPGSKGGTSRTRPDTGSQSQTPKEEAAKKNESGEGGRSSSPSSSSNRGSGGGGGSVSSVVGRRGTLQLKSPGAEAKSSRSGEIVYDSASFGGGDEGGYAIDSALGRRRRSRYRQLTGNQVYDDANAKKKKEKVIEKGGARVTASGIGEEGRPKKMTVNTQQRTKKDETQKDNWDMSRILRIALIVLMIVAILLFVFFQVSQIRKGGGG
jgi:hypothetical protein